MGAVISALATAVPPYCQEQTHLANRVADLLNLNPTERQRLQSLYQNTGINTRYSVLSDYAKLAGDFAFFPNNANSFPSTAQRMQIYKNCALPLALAAVQNCFTDSAIKPIEITHLITVSCTGMYAPGLDIELVQHLQLSSQVKRTAINFMGCYGAFNGLKVAEAFCRTDPRAKVLFVCVELCSIHFQPHHSLDNVIANAIFADGAAAVIVENNPVSGKYLSLEGFHCDLVSQSHEAMAWQIGNQGFDIVLSAYVPELIQNGILNFIQALLKKKNLTQLDYYAIHPGGLKILQACEKALRITQEDNYYAYQILRQYGNMSSATIIFVLKALWDKLSMADHNRNILSCAFGPGLSLESMLLRITVL